jgi:RNA polymerase sigma-70 factor (ECF subfamily)
MSDTADDEIVRGLKEGKSGAWSALYEAYFDQVWRSVARLIGADAAAVSDVVQDTFLAAAQSVASYDPARGPLWLWLVGIARNHVGNYYRTRRRQGRIQEGGDLAAEVSQRMTQWFENRRASPPAMLATAENAAVVRAVLGELADDYQSILTTKYCDGASVEQLAQLNGCSAMAIRSKLARARRAFREALGNHEIGFPDGRTGAHHES